MVTPSGRTPVSNTGAKSNRRKIHHINESAISNNRQIEPSSFSIFWLKVPFNSKERSTRSRTTTRATVLVTLSFRAPLVPVTTTFIICGFPTLSVGGAYEESLRRWITSVTTLLLAPFVPLIRQRNTFPAEAVTDNGPTYHSAHKMSL